MEVIPELSAAASRAVSLALPAIRLEEALSDGSAVLGQPDTAAAGPIFSFQPATPSFASIIESAQAHASASASFDNVTFVRADRSRSVTPSADHMASISPSALSAGFPDMPDNISDVGSSAGGAASLLAFAQLGAASNADATEAAQLNAMSPHVLPLTPPALSPHILPSIAGTSPDSFVGSLPAMPDPLPGASGPIRNKRGTTKDLSLDLGSDAGLSLDLFRDFSPTDGRSQDADRSQSPKEGRVIKMGDHTFTIPLKSPTVAPQLQSSVRITSTGKPSHAKKVPEGHVKVRPTYQRIAYEPN